MARQFRNPSAPTSAELDALLNGSDAFALAEALIGLTMNSADVMSAFGVVTRPDFVHHRDAGVRGAAVLCLGDLARIHRSLPAAPTIRLLRLALQDSNEWVRAQAATARSDLEQFQPELAHELSHE